MPMRSLVFSPLTFSQPNLDRFRGPNSAPCGRRSSHPDEHGLPLQSGKSLMRASSCWPPVSAPPFSRCRRRSCVMRPSGVDVAPRHRHVRRCANLAALHLLGDERLDGIGIMIAPFRRLEIRRRLRTSSSSARPGA